MIRILIALLLAATVSMNAQAFTCFSPKDPLGDAELEKTFEASSVIGIVKITKVGQVVPDRSKMAGLFEMEIELKPIKLIKGAKHAYTNRLVLLNASEGTGYKVGDRYFIAAPLDGKSDSLVSTGACGSSWFVLEKSAKKELEKFRGMAEPSR